MWAAAAALRAVAVAILIVDDEEAIRGALARVLQRHHTVDQASTVAEARQKLRDHTFELLLCDLTLADESGLELVAELADRAPETAVVMVTGVDDPNIAARAIELGVYAYLVKPFTGNEILISVASALRRRTLEIERSTYEEQAARLRLLGDRQRIALDLHDIVIQRLFAIGLSLQGARPFIVDAVIGSRVDGAIDELDLTIRRIRSVIFDMESQPQGSVRAMVLDLAGEARQTLGFEPTVQFIGAVDTLVDAHAAVQLSATLRETLSNVARHASASTVDITLAAEDDVVLTVLDDGIGMDLAGAAGGVGNGVGNMAARADRLGGRLTLTRRAAGGTRLEWRVPIDLSNRHR